MENLECLIKLNNLDQTGPKNVKINPSHQLSAEVNALPKGMLFITEFLKNIKTFIVDNNLKINN